MSHRHLPKEKSRFLLIIVLITAVQCVYGYEDIDFLSDKEYQAHDMGAAINEPVLNPIIRGIKVSGNNLVSKEAITSVIPFIVGERFNPSRTGTAIKNIFKLGYFKPDIKLFVEPIIGSNEVQVLITLSEKEAIDNFIYRGNANLKESEINKELHLSDKKTIDEPEIDTIIAQLKKLYIAKDYHHTEITAKIVPTEVNGHVNIEFDITENYPSYVKRVLFEGNKTISSKRLRALLFTREEWLFGFIKKAGSYQPDALEYDKQVIENFYQSNGFLTAHVTNVDVQEDPEDHKYVVTFYIEEGDIYTIDQLHAMGNEILSEADILNNIALRPGELYSRERIRGAIEQLRLVWGEFGYIYADVSPRVEPHPETKTVSITFNFDLGNKISVNRITILGNKKTRDYVIRRQIIFNEGEQLSTFKMDESKRRIEQLGYFDPKAGVNWRIIKLDDNLADLELIVKEIKTGQLYGQLGFGGLGNTDTKKEDVESERHDDSEVKESPSHSFKFGMGIRDNNIFGTGILWNVNGVYSAQESNLLVNISNPWLMNRPISAGLDIAVRNVLYDEFQNVNQAPNENSYSISGNIGFRVKQLDNALTVIDSGIERIRFPFRPQAFVPAGYEQFRQSLQMVINERFRSGELVWLGLSLSQDTRNHPMYPSRGYLWAFNSRCALPHLQDNFAFFRTEIDARWYTPLIEEYNLVFHLHAHAGYIKGFPNRHIPYRELFHVGGPTTVRGFIFGQIGPTLIVNPSFGNSSIGATKEFFINAELQFPIKYDMTIRGVLFYDGGAGWDTPDSQYINPLLLRNNNFNYRHSIGFGVRMTYPTPVRIDWGFKLDRNKRRGESESEMHFTVLQEF